MHKMSKQGINLQDSLLNQARKENIQATVFLVNGYQLRGVIRSFDNFTILLEVDGKQQLVYKHAVSTVIPSRNLKINLTSEENNKSEE